jgi:N-acetylmuramoyl-L-alanine amidase
MLRKSTLRKVMKRLNDLLPEKGMSPLEVLARTIFAEANGEKYQGKVAVGAVICNRVKKNWAKSHLAVVAQIKDGYKQFSSYPKYFYKAPYWSKKPIEKKAIDKCKRAAKAALKNEDPTYGRIYFCRYCRPPKSSKPYPIGKHIC